MKRLLASLMVGGVLLVGASAGAATSTGYGAWTPVTGVANAFATTVQLPGTGYPLARVTSDSVGAQQPSGATTFFNATTPPGLVFGSSLNQPYLNLRPFSNAQPSTTTYTFDTAVPIGWGFVLGDIDSDKVAVSATLADGTPAATAQLGFQSTFNPCLPAPAPTPRPAPCTDPTVLKELPTWDPATATLTGSATAADTFGASGWFMPTVPLKTLTLTFSYLNGFPVYQTWFAARSQDVTGTVSVSGGTCDVTATTLSLVAGSGTVLATTKPAADGSYSFPKVAATNAFSVTLGGLPADCLAVGTDTRPVDLRTASATADFSLQQQLPATVSGTVTEKGSGDPVRDAVVDIGVPGPDLRDTTGREGGYTIPDVPPGEYDVTVRAAGDVTKHVDLVVPPTGSPITRNVVLTPLATSVAAPSGPSVASSTSSTPAAPGAIPDVGGVSAWWLALAVGLLGAGGVLLVHDRRSRLRG